MNIKNKITANREFLLFFTAIVLVGFSQSLVDSTFNNFLNETFSLTNMQRGVLELPREMPGFLVIFFSAAFFFLPPRRLAALSLVLAALGIILVGYQSVSFSIMLVWLFMFSSGQHIFMPLNSSISMEFSKDGRDGSRLGQLSGSMNLAAIVGSFAVFIGFKYAGMNFSGTYLLAAAGFISAAALIFMMKPDAPLTAKSRFVMKKEYTLFYWLNILFGTRKQIFLTFAPWVLVTVYKQETAAVATLLTIGGVIGIFFKPMLGRAIDRLGERVIMMSEAFLLVWVCLGYGFSLFLFEGSTALYVAFGCFIADQLLMSVSMARATYLKKIALKPEDISQTLTMGVTIDHVFSITIALISGYIWHSLGYQYIFLLGAAIAVVNFFSASRVRTQAAG